MADIFAIFTKEIDDILKPNKLIKVDNNLYIPDEIFEIVFKNLFDNIKNDMEVVKYFALIKILSKEKYELLKKYILPKLTANQKYFISYQIKLQKKFKYRYLEKNKTIMYNREQYYKNIIIYDMECIKWDCNKTVFINCVFYDPKYGYTFFSTNKVKNQRNIICIGCIFTSNFLKEDLGKISFMGCVFINPKASETIAYYSNVEYKNALLLLSNSTRLSFLPNQEKIINRINNILKRIILSDEIKLKLNDYINNQTQCIICKYKQKCYKPICLNCKCHMFVDDCIIKNNMDEIKIVIVIDKDEKIDDDEKIEQNDIIFPQNEKINISKESSNHNVKPPTSSLAAQQLHENIDTNLPKNNKYFTDLAFNFKD